MKVKLDITVEVDVDGWAVAYGFDPEDVGAIRRDVRSWAAIQVDNPTGENLVRVVRGVLMQVIFVCDNEKQAKFVRDNADTIREGLEGLMFWPGTTNFDVVPQLRPPNREELLGLLAALGGHPTVEERMEWEYAELEEQSRRPGSGVYRL